MQWMRSVAGQVQGVIAIDGKTVRGATPAGSARHALHMVSAWAADMGLLLGQRKVDGKSNEITAIPQLLRLLDVQGCILCPPGLSQISGVRHFCPRLCQGVV